MHDTVSLFAYIYVFLCYNDSVYAFDGTLGDLTPTTQSLSRL